MKYKITKKELEKWSKEELIKFALLRNDDAKDYAKEITRLQKKLKEALKR